MQRDEYMAAFRLGVPVECRGIRYRYISAVVCRRMLQNGENGRNRIYVELEMMDNTGNSVSYANPREVNIIDRELFNGMCEAAGIKRAESIQPGRTGEDPGIMERGVYEPGDREDCGKDENCDCAAQSEDAEKRKEKRFVKPSLEEITEYCREKGYEHVDPTAFWAHYESVGWRVGKNPMKNWHAAAAGWNAREKAESFIKEPEKQKSGSFETDAFFEAAVARSYSD